MYKLQTLGNQHGALVDRKSTAVLKCAASNANRKKFKLTEPAANKLAGITWLK